MISKQTSDGFSTYVSFILVLSNLIRLFWWYSERFSLVILFAAILMVLCQMVLLYFWVKIKNEGVERRAMENQAIALGGGINLA